MTKNFKGGYKIVSLNGNDLTSADAFTIEGLYASLENSYKKPILVTEIVIDGEKEQDAYAVVKKNESGYSIEVYGYALTVTDEDSVTSVALPEITSIGTGLDLTDGELSASGGGGGSSLYCHAIEIIGSESGSAYRFMFKIFSYKDTPFTSISDVIDVLYKTGGSVTSMSYFSAIGKYATSGIIVGIFLSSNKPTTTIFVGTFNSLSSADAAFSQQSITLSGITNFYDNVFMTS